jgi:hypothetical protein
MSRRILSGFVAMIITVGTVQLATTAIAAGGGQVALSPAETATLVFMREEEKVARDVYLKMYEVWGDPVFATIAASEQQHMDAILKLLNKYGIADPAKAAAGEFTNPELQAMYNQLVADGAASLLAAFQVGVVIEQTDIADLQAAIAGTTKGDLRQVYTNLLNGSLRHLATFESHVASVTP